MEGLAKFCKVRITHRRVSMDRKKKEKYCQSSTSDTFNFLHNPFATLLGVLIAFVNYIITIQLSLHYSLQ